MYLLTTEILNQLYLYGQNTSIYFLGLSTLRTLCDVTLRREHTNGSKSLSKIRKFANVTRILQEMAKH